MTVDNNLFDSLFLENRSISMALDSFAESVKDDFLFMRSAQKKSYNSTTDVTSNKNNNTDEAPTNERARERENPAYRKDVDMMLLQIGQKQVNQQDIEVVEGGKMAFLLYQKGFFERDVTDKDTTDQVDTSKSKLTDGDTVSVFKTDSSSISSDKDNLDESKLPLSSQLAQQFVFDKKLDIDSSVKQPSSDEEVKQRQTPTKAMIVDDSEKNTSGAMNMLARSDGVRRPSDGKSGLERRLESNIVYSGSQHARMLTDLNGAELMVNVASPKNHHNNLKGEDDFDNTLTNNLHIEEHNRSLGIAVDPILTNKMGAYKYIR